MNPIKAVFSYLEKKSDERLRKDYRNAGIDFAEDVSYSFMEKPVSFDIKLDIWKSLEEEYANKGYRTVSLDKFLENGVYSNTIDTLIGKKRENNENPIFHAKIFKNNGCCIDPVLDISDLMSGSKESQMGTYTLPSTEVFVEK